MHQFQYTFLSSVYCITYRHIYIRTSNFLLCTSSTYKIFMFSLTYSHDASKDTEVYFYFLYFCVAAKLASVSKLIKARPL